MMWRATPSDILFLFGVLGVLFPWTTSLSCYRNDSIVSMIRAMTPTHKRALLFYGVLVLMTLRQLSILFSLYLFLMRALRPQSSILKSCHGLMLINRLRCCRSGRVSTHLVKSRTEAPVSCAWFNCRSITKQNGAITSGFV